MESLFGLFSSLLDLLRIMSFHYLLKLVGFYVSFYVLKIWGIYRYVVILFRLLSRPQGAESVLSWITSSYALPLRVADSFLVSPVSGGALCTSDRERPSGAVRCCKRFVEPSFHVNFSLWQLDSTWLL